METDLAQLANDRFEIADALHRYAFGLDHGDADSLASALTEDCRFDFRPAGRKLAREARGQSLLLILIHRSNNSGQCDGTNDRS